MQGLSAARALQCCGFLVTVVEARDRVGGRCYTTQHIEVNVDLGAADLWGGKDNPNAGMIPVLFS